MATPTKPKKKTRAASAARSVKRASPKSSSKAKKVTAATLKKRALQSMLALHTSDKNAEFKKHEHDQIFEILQKQNVVYRKKLADRHFKGIAEKRRLSYSVVQIESLKDALEDSYSKFVKKWHAAREDFSKTFAHSIDRLLSLTIRKQGLDQFPAYVRRPSIATTQQRRTSLSSSGELKVFDNDDSYGSPTDRDSSPEAEDNFIDSPSRSRSSSLGSLAGSTNSSNLEERNIFHQRLVDDARAQNTDEVKGEKNILRNLGTQKQFLTEVKTRLEIYKRHLNKSNKASKDDYLLNDKKNAVEVLIRRAEENDYEGFNKEWAIASEIIKKHRPKAVVGFKMKFTAAFPYEGKKLIEDIEKMNANLAKPAHYNDSRNAKKRGEVFNPKNQYESNTEDHYNESTTSRKRRRIS